MRFELIAHRAGNDVSRLRMAEAAGVDFVEADVQLLGDRAVLRHPSVFRGRELAREPWLRAVPSRRLTLERLVETAAPTTSLMLDLKGTGTQLVDAVLRAIAPAVGIRPLTVCGREWTLLERFEEVDGVTVVYTAATADALLALLGRERRMAGVSVAERLLNARVVQLLRESAETVTAWTVNSRSRALELAAMGADAIVTDDVHLCRERTALNVAA